MIAGSRRGMGAGRRGSRLVPGSRWWTTAPALAGATLAALLVAGCGSSGNQAVPTSGRSRSPAAGAAPTTTPSTLMPAPTTVPPTTVPPTNRLSSAPATPPAPAPAPAPLGPGSSGPAVLALQQRLTSMGYWMGAPDGHFGDTTTQAVYALQKAAGLGRDGLVGPATSAAIAQGVVPHPRSTSGHVIEVDLQRDLLMLVSDGKLQYVLNTSTGGGYTYTDQGTTSVADTPVGQFHVFRQVDGMVTNSLGQLWRPKFFDGGFAVHGDSDVPPYPVSHGCARVSNEAIDWIWSNNLAPIGTEVWVY
ncbi:MAG TPA: L,D-transpeptidase family protein [Acidimicrobiales bacterium]